MSKIYFNERVSFNAEINRILSGKEYLDVEDPDNEARLQEWVARMLKGGEDGRQARENLIVNSLPLLGNVVKCYCVNQENDIDFVETIYSEGYCALIHALEILKQPLSMPFGKYARNYFNKGIKAYLTSRKPENNPFDLMDFYDDDCDGARLFNSRESDTSICHEFLQEDNLQDTRDIFRRILSDMEFRIIDKMMTDDLSWSEIAEEWCSNPTTVRSHYMHALKKIRRYSNHSNVFHRLFFATANREYLIETPMI